MSVKIHANNAAKTKAWRHRNPKTPAQKAEHARLQRLRYCGDYRERQLRQKKERRENDREWAENKNKYTREQHRLKKFGLTPEEFEKMLEDQDGLCGICAKKFNLTGPNHERPQIDHDHNTGRVRGLLCFKCNVSLGWYEKINPATIATYLAFAIDPPANDV